MSTLVKGMEMPKGCDDCPLYGIDLRCKITYTPNYTDGRFVERARNCPLVEVVRTGDGLYDTYTPPDKETAKHVTEVFRKSTERMEAEE